VTVTGRRVHQDTCPRFCHSPGGLLHVLAGTPRSVTDRLQRVRYLTPRQWNAQVRPWTVAAATYRLALARCDRSSPVQARHHSSPVSARQSAKVPDRLLCRCLGYRWSSETALSTPSSAGCTALSTNNTRTSGVLCDWTYRQEFASRRAKIWDWKHFLAVTENTAFQTTLVCSAHWRFSTTMRYINRHFTCILTVTLISTCIMIMMMMMMMMINGDRLKGRPSLGDYTFRQFDGHYMILSRWGRLNSLTHAFSINRSNPLTITMHIDYVFAALSTIKPESAKTSRQHCD